MENVKDVDVVIVLDGGLVQNVYTTNTGPQSLSLMVVDTDKEGADVTDLARLGSGGRLQRACVSVQETQQLDSIEVKYEVDTYEGTDQPETCPKCGIRTEFSQMDAIDQYHACPACGYEYILEFNNN